MKEINQNKVNAGAQIEPTCTEAKVAEDARADAARTQAAVAHDAEHEEEGVETKRETYKWNDGGS